MPQRRAKVHAAKMIEIVRVLIGVVAMQLHIHLGAHGAVHIHPAVAVRVGNATELRLELGPESIRLAPDG